MSAKTLFAKLTFLSLNLLVILSFFGLISKAQQPPQVTVDIHVDSDGSEPFDGATWNGSTNAGQDAGDSNYVVRTLDQVVYQVQINLNHADSNNLTFEVTLDNAKWINLPRACNIDSTLYSPVSSISTNGRTLVCNLGIKEEGTTTLVNLVAQADVVQNDTKLFANVTAQSYSPSSNVHNARAERVTITGAPKVDLIKTADSTYDANSGTTFYEVAFIREYNNAGTLGDIIMYRIDIQHQQGSEPFTDTSFSLRDEFAYIGGAASGSNNAVLFHPDGSACWVNPAYAATSGSITCTNAGMSGALTKLTDINLTGVSNNPANIGDDGIVGSYYVSFFIPKTDQPVVPASLQLRNTAFGAGAGFTGFHPQNSNGDFNFNNVNEYLHPGTDTNNYIEFALTNPVPGNMCGNFYWQTPGPTMYIACPNVYKQPVTQYVSAGELRAPSYYINMGDPLPTPVVDGDTIIVCGVATPDTVNGGYMFEYTGRMYPGLDQFIDWTPDVLNATNKVRREGITMLHWRRNQSGDFQETGWRNDGTYFVFGFDRDILSDYLPATNDFVFMENMPISGFQSTLEKTSEILIQYNNTPVTPGTEFQPNCDDSVGTWVTQPDVPGYATLPGPITRFRALITHHEDDTDIYADYYFLPEVKMSDNLTVDQKIPGYMSYRVPTNPDIYGGNYDFVSFGIGDLAPGDPSLNYDPNNPGNTAITQQFKGVNGQDVLFVAQATEKIYKEADRVTADPGEVVNYTVTPKIYALSVVTNQTVTVTDVLPTGLILIPTSIYTECESLSCSGTSSITINPDGYTVTYTGFNGGSSLPVIHYQAYVDPYFTNGRLTNTAVISNALADNYTPIGDRTAVETISVVQPGGHVIRKYVDKLIDQVNSSFTFDIALFNSSLQDMTGPLDYIDVLPFNGDGSAPQSRFEPSNFSGTATFGGIIANDPTLGGATTYEYTKAVPGTINQDPRCASNNTGSTTYTGQPVYSSADKNGNGVADATEDANNDGYIDSTLGSLTNYWAFYCPLGDTPTTWCTDYTSGGSCPATMSEVTAVRLKINAGLVRNAPGASYTLIMNTAGNIEGDIYTNSFSGRSADFELPVISNDVTVTVVEGSIGNSVWFDNGDGVQQASELPMPNVCLLLVGTDTTPGAYGTVTDVTKLDPGADMIFGTPDDQPLTTMTDVNGNYLFEHLHSGDYSVTVILDPSSNSACPVGSVAYPAAAFEQTYDLDDGATLTPSTPNTTDITICPHYELALNNQDQTIPDPTNSNHPTLMLNEFGEPILISVDDKANNIPTDLNQGDQVGSGLLDCNEEPIGYLEDADFGYRPLLSLSGYVYHDNRLSSTTPDGVVNPADDLPIENVTLEIFTGPACDVPVDPDGAGPLTNYVVTTDATGYYEFEFLMPGTYCIVETQPAGYVDSVQIPCDVGGTSTDPDTISAITLTDTEGQQCNFLEEGVNLSGYVYHDNGLTMTNPDGTVNLADDKPIENVLIDLMNAGCTAAADPDGAGSLTSISDTTDATGYYEFTNLIPGTYCLDETQPTAYVDSVEIACTVNGSASGSTATNDQIQSIDMTQGFDGVQCNFLEVGVDISGHVYHDNGLDMTEPNQTVDASDAPIPGVTLELYDSACTTAYNPDGSSTLHVRTTDAAGYYEFLNVPLSGYCVDETQPTNYLDGYDVVGSQGGTAVQDDTFSAINLTADGINYDFLEEGVNLSGYVYHDNGLNMTDPDGVVNTATDAPIPGVLLEMYDSTCTTAYVPYTGSTAFTDTTDAVGYYEIVNVPLGDYCVVENQPAAYDDGNDIPGSLGGTAPQDDTIQAITLTADATDYDFLEVGLNLSGHVWHDNGLTMTDPNQTVDSEDAPIPNVFMELFDETCTTAYVPYTGSLTFTDDTDALGYYEFTNIPRGDYCITEYQPAAYDDGFDVAGNLGGTTPQDDSIRAIALTVDGINYDFLEEGVNLSGYVLHDNGLTMTDPNQTVDSEDAPIPNVFMELLDDNCNSPYVPYTGSLIFTDYTAADGYYEFTNIPKDLYCIFENQPANFNDGFDVAGSLGGTTPQNDTIHSISLTTDGVNYDFLEEGINLSGYVFHDNGLTNTLPNQTRDSEDAPIPGVFMELYNANCTTAYVPYTGTLIFTDTTDATGYYEFTNVPLDLYCIQENQPANFNDGRDYSCTINTATSGNILAANDEIQSINTRAGVDATRCDFLEEGINLSGHVYHDNGLNMTPPDQIVDTATDAPIPGVFMELYNSDCTTAYIPYTGSLLFTDNTDAIGYYEFLNVPFDAYCIVENQPTNFNDGVEYAGNQGGTTPQDDTIQAISIATIDGINYDFLEEGVNLSGTVKHDNGLTMTDPDQTRNIDDGPIPGVFMELYNADCTTAYVPYTGSLIFTDNTDAVGYYEFTNVPLDLYCIQENQPSNFNDGVEFSCDVNGVESGDTSTNDQIQSIDITGGVGSVTCDFLEEGINISGHVFHDNGLNMTDPNQTVDAFDAPIPGVFMELLDTTCTTAYVPYTGTLVFTDNTELLTGYYEFTNVPFDEYCIRENQPAAYDDGVEFAGNQGGTVPQNDTILAIPLATIDGVNYDFLEEGINLSGYVLHDNGYTMTDPNQIVDADDKPIEGVLIQMFDGTCTTQYVPYTGSMPFEHNTLVDGYYEITNVPRDLYCLVETQPINFLDGVEIAGNLGGTTPQNDTISAINLTEDGILYYFLEEGIDLSGHVYHDNGYELTAPDGIVDPLMDKPLQLVEMYLKENNCTDVYDPDGVGATYAYRLTDTSGYYIFKNVPISEYCIDETQPVGYEDGVDTQCYVEEGNTFTNVPGDYYTGIVNETVPDNNIVQINAYNDGFNCDFLEYGTAEIEGFAFKDFDADGKFDGGDVFHPEAYVTMYFPVVHHEVGDVTKTVKVLSYDGTYEFTYLPVGNYYLTFNEPTDWNFTKTLNTAANDILDSDVYSSGTDIGKLTYVIGLEMYEINSHNDVGYRETSDEADIDIDLEYSKEEDKCELVEGEELKVKLTVKNVGSDALHDVELSMNLPHGVDLRKVTTNEDIEWSYDDDNIYIDSVPDGEKYVFTIVLQTKGSIDGEMEVNFEKTREVEEHNEDNNGDDLDLSKCKTVSVEELSETGFNLTMNYILIGILISSLVAYKSIN